MEIGKKVKDLRIQYGLTQEELASRCELSKGFISMLENDLTSPSVSTMQDLLEVFGLTMSEFFMKFDEEDDIVYKKEDYFTKENNEYTIEYLIADAQSKQIEPLKVILAKEGKTELVCPHEGDMFGYILKGKVELFVNNRLYVLKTGDSFYYSKPHTNQYIKNLHKAQSEILWISTPPVF
ncbi:MAG: helix-turn-helix domain-containing protein [Bacilli bacterium]